MVIVFEPRDSFVVKLVLGCGLSSRSDSVGNRPAQQSPEENSVRCPARDVKVHPDCENSVQKELSLKSLASRHTFTRAAGRIPFYERIKCRRKGRLGPMRECAES